MLLFLTLNAKMYSRAWLMLSLLNQILSIMMIFVSYAMVQADQDISR